MNRLIWTISGILLGLMTADAWPRQSAAMPRLEPPGASKTQPQPRDAKASEKLLLKLRKAKLEAARQTYNVVSKNFNEGPVRGVELPYRWSCRLLEAERQMSAEKSEQISAFQRHVERMQNVERVARDLYRARVNTINEVTAAEYYRREAEIWLVQARD